MLTTFCTRMGLPTGPYRTMGPPQYGCSSTSHISNRELTVRAEGEWLADCSQSVSGTYAAEFQSRPSPSLRSGVNPTQLVALLPNLQPRAFQDLLCMRLLSALTCQAQYVPSMAVPTPSPGHTIPLVPVELTTFSLRAVST